MRKVSTKVIPPTSPHRRVSPGEKAAPPCLGCARGGGAQSPLFALLCLPCARLQVAGGGAGPGAHTCLWVQAASQPAQVRGQAACMTEGQLLVQEAGSPGSGAWQGPAGPFSCVFAGREKAESPPVSCVFLRGHQSHERPACTAPRLWAPPGGPTSNIITGEWGFAQESGGGGCQHSAGRGLGRLVQGVSRLCTLAPGPPAPRGLHLLALAAELLAPARPACRPGQCPSCVRSSRSA